MRFVYRFGDGSADGSAAMKELLGGKGANLAEMANLGLPVPPGFTITTEACIAYMRTGKLPDGIEAEIRRGLAFIEKSMGRRFGDREAPLLLSCRSGARASMPGMMETVLNIGLSRDTLPGLGEMSGDERFALDSYRRLMMMYADVVMEKAEGIEPGEGRGIRSRLEKILKALKEKTGREDDSRLTAADLTRLCDRFEKLIAETFDRPFPDDPMEQLLGSIRAVFRSWNGKRAVAYRRIEGLPDDWGTAVNIQAMVFGNLGRDSATGVAFTRNPATGEARFYGEWLRNAQGEDVVAGIRTPNPLNEAGRTGEGKAETLETAMPKLYRELDRYRLRLEKHFRDMQDLEFTIESGRLWMLQTRTGKRTGVAAVNIAMDMLAEKLIDEKTAILRVRPDQLDELLHPIVDPTAEKKEKPLLEGLPAGPGGAVGRVVFTAADAVARAKGKDPVILVREETSPEDVDGMRAAAGIITARGGMTSHAALVARGWGKCCIVGARNSRVDSAKKRLVVNGKTVKEGDWLTLNGTSGRAYAGRLPMIDASEQPQFRRFMKLADRYRQMRVRTNAETPTDATLARRLGAEGIGLFRTEHMFYGKGSDKPLFLLRRMIMSRTAEERKAALDKLFRHVRKTVRGTLAAMDGLPVTIRLLDPPLHEFVPRDKEKQRELAEALGVSVAEIRRRGEALHETNPMMGHRGVRLGISYPEITAMQARAVFEAAAELLKKRKKPIPEIMIPVTCEARELADQNAIIARVHDEVCRAAGLKRIPHLVGTMIEIPRAALTAGEMAGPAEFFSFGTNDLTQMTFGFSRDDAGAFLGEYLDRNLLPADPFATIDRASVGELIRLAVERGRSARPNLKVGICGEHGGDPASVRFCHEVGMDYVSCSPYRVPVARLATAQAALAMPRGKGKTRR
ncbi:MAG TPA: pyruvate, phosphate dikinase [candidate division WOR-3 bacterium]|uniref:Pyruvate, phosphate dikinase n=1 Tax=candidate division WOR-3 bacterium TaxID=2052148 RepID=A0A7V0T7D0_UNCW3|nr:pyruvate, phosphate dikinase [candidate division WOR-3 bacterium]